MTTAERIESLKAGILTALSFTLAYSIALVGNSLVLAQFEELAALQIPTPVNLLVKVAAAWVEWLSLWRHLPLCNSGR
jgi:cellobiose-specific phosphotransferase system component IIC